MDLKDRGVLGERYEEVGEAGCLRVRVKEEESGGLGAEHLPG